MNLVRWENVLKYLPKMMNDVTKATFKKLGCIVDTVLEVITRIEGKVSNTDVAITIMTDDKHITIAGQFDDCSDTFPVQVWKDGVPAGKMNWYPVGSLDLVNFDNDFTEIYYS